MTESKMATVLEFKMRACEELGLEPEKARLWDYYNKNKYADLESGNNLNQTLTDLRIFEEQDILLEVQNEEYPFIRQGSWPHEENPRAALASYGSISNPYGGISEAALQTCGTGALFVFIKAARE